MSRFTTSTAAHLHYFIVSFWRRPRLNEEGEVGGVLCVENDLRINLIILHSLIRWIASYGREDPLNDSTSWRIEVIVIIDR